METVIQHPHLASGIAAGIASWLYLHKHDVRGDRALVFYVAAVGALYTAASILTAAPLRTTATIASSYFASLALVTVGYRLSPWHPLASFPGPLICRVSSLWLTSVSLTGRRHLVIDRLHKNYGPFLRIAPNTLSLNTPSGTAVYHNTDKSESYRFPAHDGLMSLFFKQDDKERLRERKRVWTKLFTATGIAELTPALEKRTWQLFKCFERRQAANNGYIDLPQAFYHWSHDFMGDMVFSGYNEFELMKNGDPQGIISCGKTAVGSMDCFGHSPWFLDIVFHIPTTRDMRLLVERAAEMTHRRLAAKELPGFRDLMSYLIEGEVGVAELERDAVTAILGGSDNSSIALALGCYFLTAEPRYYKLLREELEKAFPDPFGPLPLSTLAGLPILNGVVQESLRLGSPYFLPRIIAPGGIHIDGRYIPEGTNVALAAYTQQMSEENFYPDPTCFRPERWIPEGLGPDTKTNKALLASFSYGQHACVGKVLAYHEMRYVLSRVVLAYDMEFRKDFDIQAFRDGMLNMRTTILEKDMFVKVTRRPNLDLDGVLEKL